MRKTILILLAGVVFLTPLIICPSTIDYYNTPKELFSQLAIILCLVLWLRMGIENGKFEILAAKFCFLLLLFCAILGASILSGKSAYLGLRDYIQVITYTAAFFICVNTVKKKEAGMLVTFAFIAGAISAIYAILQYSGLDFIKYPSANFPDWRFRLYSTFGNPDFLANYLILVFPAGVAIYLSTEKISKKLFFLPLLILIFIALLLTFSVGALSGFILSMIFTAFIFAFDYLKVMYFVPCKKGIRYLGISVIVLVLLSGFFTVFFFMENGFHSPSIINRAKSSFAWRHGLDNRLILYKSACQMIKDRPFRGIGLGNFKLRLPEYRARILQTKQQYIESSLLDREQDKNVLNEFLQLWAETGILGFLIFLLILIEVSKTVITGYRDVLDYKRRLFVLGLTAGITAFLIHSLVSFPLHVVPCALVFWIFLGLLFTQLEARPKTVIPLNIGPTQKKIWGAAIGILAIIASIWPARFYISEIFFKRMVTLDTKGMLNQALMEADTALFFDPNSNAVLYVGNYALMIKDYKGAIQSLQTMLKNNDAINYHVALAEAYYNEKLPRDCTNEYKKAVLLNPFNVNMRIRLAELYAEFKRYDEAEAECRFLLLNYPDNHEIKKRLTGILQTIFKEKVISFYYGKISTRQ